MNSKPDLPDFGLGPFGAEFDATPPPPEKPAPPPPPPPRHEFPLGWLLDKAAAPIQYRSLIEVARVAPSPTLLPSLIYGYGPALRLMLSQRNDGSWSEALSTPPTSGSRGEFAGLGTATACHRLLECGWDRESPPLHSARRLMFRLLAEDGDPTLSFEHAADGSDVETVTRSRAIVREAAAAVLAQAGYENDPRLRGAATRITNRIRAYLMSPLSEDPWVRVAGKTVLTAEAAPPSLNALVMLAFMPRYLNEHHEMVDLLSRYFQRSLPRHAPAQVIGARVLPNPTLVLGDPLGGKGVPDSDIPFALWWLELVSRLGMLRGHEGWARAFDHLLGSRDRDHVWRGGRAARFSTLHPRVWPSVPLQPDGPDAASVDVTFRLGLIARYSGRTVDLV